MLKIFLNVNNKYATISGLLGFPISCISWPFEQNVAMQRKSVSVSELWWECWYDA
jgi:hypothetical protein